MTNNTWLAANKQHLDAQQHVAQQHLGFHQQHLVAEQHLDTLNKSRYQRFPR